MRDDAIEIRMMRRLLAMVVHTALRAIATFMMAAGGAALVAAPFVMRPASPDSAEWIVPIRDGALAIGIAFLGAAIVALVVWPARRELLRWPSEPSVPALPAGALALLGGLAGFSVWQVPTLLAWWAESLELVGRMTEGERDPLGLWIIPATLLCAPPFLATLAVVLFVLTSVAVAAAPAALAFRVQRACLLLQGGLVIGSSVALAPLRRLAAYVMTLAASGPDRAVAATMADVLERQGDFAAASVDRCQWLLAGYVLVTFVLWYWRHGAGIAAHATPAADTAPPVGPSVAGVLPVADRPPAPSSTASSAFGSAAYRVRLRSPWILAAFRIGSLDYSVTPLWSSAAEASFSFSSRDGVLRREPGGPPVLTVRPEGRAWVLGSSYVVVDASSGAVVAILEPAGRDWNVLDDRRQPLAQVEEVDTRRGHCRYRMRVGPTEVCRFTWAMHGLGVWTAEMDVEFPDGAPGGFERSHAMALAPILESQARRISQRIAS